jgi:hypothetical protein
VELTQGDIDALVERRIAKLRRHHGRETLMLLTLCAALARECARLRYRLRVDRKQGRNRR